MSRGPCVVLVLIIALTASAEIPQVISYQGKVTDATGTPLADGPYTMRFRIYDAVNAGTLKWDSNAQTVAVAGGIFSVLLGESPQAALTLAFDQDYWLQVTFGGVDQAPRQRLASSGYAYMASGLVAGTEVSGNVTNGTLSAIKGTNTATSGSTYGVYGESASTSGLAVYGYATATSGYPYGVYGRTDSSAGRGVYGLANTASGVTYGVHGQNASNAGVGVHGYASATSGTTYGGHFESRSSAGRGVYGYAAATSGTTYGIYGQNASTGGYGVYGYASATSGATYGAYFESRSSAGRSVYGYAAATSGTTYGIYGLNASSTGRGVHGHASATSGMTYGVYGYATSTGGYGVYFSGGLAGSGNKSCVVKTSRGPTLLYCQESPESWFEDFGEGTLVSGRCHIELDPVFLETVTIDTANPMKVFVQACDESCLDLIVHRGQAAFDVVSPTRPDASGAFMYRVVAKRLGFEAKRLEVCEAARTDSYLYPELKEKERARMEEEQARMEEERARMEEEMRVRHEEERAALAEQPAVGTRQ